ncbi:hypothetical protein CUMW_255000 [Citrus unshiu]|uniref:Retropepsins domain-containing protein n=1 Tax=Citrus unshiu TaxID=55188 RepID=A0A2H5QRK7_CITUN|nr:hypothetical protein CUMW_255000 [Citrus unshiu]
MLLSDIDDVEYFFSEQEEYDEQTAFVLAGTEDHSESENVYVIQTVQQIQKVQPVIPIPSIKIHLLLEKFGKPIPIIGFIDTGAQKSMLNPSILPSYFWEKHTEHFRAANGELFHINLITKKSIGIQFFPGFIDTGAQKSMLNPSILPSHFWEKHTEHFRVANGELFHTNLITKKSIGIQFFPGCENTWRCYTRTTTVKTVLWTGSPQVRVSSRYTSKIKKI